jgi:hypothetical protein
MKSLQLELNSKVKVISPRLYRQYRKAKQDDIMAMLQILSIKLKRNMEFVKEKGSSV